MTLFTNLSNRYGAGDSFGSGNCNVDTTACGFHDSPGYNAAASENLFGVGPGAGAGPACHKCYHLVLETDSSGKPASGQVTVKINNLCPAQGNVLCAQQGLSGTNQFGSFASPSTEVIFISPHLSAPAHSFCKSILTDWITQGRTSTSISASMAGLQGRSFRRVWDWVLDMRMKWPVARDRLLRRSLLLPSLLCFTYGFSLPIFSRLLPTSSATPHLKAMDLCKHVPGQTTPTFMVMRGA